LHKDIKPSNLIWSQTEHVYLVDFGNAQDKVAQTGGKFTVVGTYGYTPMEQFGGKAVPASDLYALGATLIHLLTGIAPADLPQKNFRIQFRDRVYISPNLALWIERLTEPDLAKRFSSAQEAMKSLISDIPLSFEQVKQSTFLQFPQPEKVTKPPYTRVKLIQTAERLEVKIPMRGVKNLTDGLRFISCIGILALCCCFFFIKEQFLVTLLLVLLFAPFGIPAIILIGFIFRSTACFFSSNVVVFSGDRTEVERRILGLTYHRCKILTQSIQSISIIPTDWSSQSASITITSISHLKQYVRCSFGSNLSEAELVWLMLELRNWLQIVQMSNE
jgi:serine/threonine protein kinase